MNPQRGAQAPHLETHMPTQSEIRKKKRAALLVFLSQDKAKAMKQALAWRLANEKPQPKLTRRSQ
jgi:hypothetical protein